MTHNLKALGLVIVAVLSLGAVVGSTASASEFTASVYSGGTTATASSFIGNDDFKTEAGSLECATHYHIGPLVGPAESVTVDVTYSGCKSFGFLNSAVHMNGCDYTFFTNGNVDLTCEAGEGPITITSATCELQIHGQKGLSKVDLSSNGTDISMQMTVTGTNYTVTKDGFGCPFSGTGAKNGATYTQNAPVTITGNSGRTISIS